MPHCGRADAAAYLQKVLHLRPLAIGSAR